MEPKCISSYKISNQFYEYIQFSIDELCINLT